jgi:deazaflavin-dependent oxidoreductase (nitroreductase family)
MPLPRWLAKINRRVFNPMEIKRGKRPVLTHVGRSSGKTYHTPLDAHPFDGGYVFILMYGSGSDWVQNILSAGEASLKTGKDHHDLVGPRVVGRDEARELLSGAPKLPPALTKASEFLVMDLHR